MNAKLFHHACWILLGWLAAGPWAAALTFDGYENPAPMVPGTEIVLPLQEVPSQRPFSFQTPFQDPAGGWREQCRGIVQKVCYLIPQPTSGESPPTTRSDPKRWLAVIDLVSHVPGMTPEQFTVQKLFANPEHYTFRMLYDVNGDRSFGPGEIVEVPFRAPELRQNWVNLTFEFLDPTTPLAGGKPAPIKIRLTVYLHEGTVRENDPVKMFRNAANGWSHYGYLPLAADLPSTVTGALRLVLKEKYQDGRLIVTGYAQGRPRGDYMDPVGMSHVALEEPMPLGDRWLVIKRIARDLSTLTLAEPAAGSRPPDRGQVGARLPDFARVDLLTRRIVNTTGLKGKTVVIVFPGRPVTQPSYRPNYEYNGYRLLAERISRAGGGQVTVLFVCPEVRWDELLPQLAGRPELPFMMLLDTDFKRFREFAPHADYVRRREQPPLSSQFWRNGEEPLTLVADSTGMILMREARSLTAVLPKVMGMLKALHD